MTRQKLFVLALLLAAPTLWAKAPVLKSPPYTYEVAKDWQLVRSWYF